MARRSSKIDASVRRVMQGCLYDIFCRCADSTPERTRLENLKSEKVRTWKSQVKHTELEGLSGSKIQDPGFFPLNSFPRENYFPQTKIPKKIHWGEIISLNIFPRGKLFPKFFPLGVYFFLKSVPSGAIISNLFPRGKIISLNIFPIINRISGQQRNSLSLL